MTADPEARSAAQRQRGFWPREALAGLAGAIGSVPDGMATAVLAGATPMTGLYASIAGPIAGGMVGSTGVMVVATTSAAAVTTAQLATTATADPAGTLATLTAVSAAFMLVATLAGFARLVRFVSASVMGGFLFGIGLILILGQLGDATGVTAHGSSILAKAWDTLRQAGSFHPAAVATTLAAIVLTAVAGRTRIAPVAPLVGIGLPTLVLFLSGTRVDTVADQGAITLGLPPLVLPRLALVTPDLLATAAALTVVVLVQVAGVAAAYPNQDGRSNDVRRDFLAQAVANAGSALVGGIPVGGSVGQTAINVLAGARSRWASIFSGVWMLIFVVALGPVLGVVPIPALAGLLMLAGITSLRPERLRQSWAAGVPSFTAAIITMLATLLLPVHLAVLTGVVLSLALVGLDAASAVRVVGLRRVAAGSWRRDAEVPVELGAGSIAVVDVEGPGAFASVPRLFAALPSPSVHGSGAVVVRLRGHVRPNLTLALALDGYAARHAAAGGTVIVCGLTTTVIERLRAMGVGPAAVLLPEAAHLGGSLEEAFAVAGEATAGPADETRTTASP